MYSTEKGKTQRGNSSLLSQEVISSIGNIYQHIGKLIDRKSLLDVNIKGRRLNGSILDTRHDVVLYPDGS